VEGQGRLVEHRANFTPTACRNGQTDRHTHTLTYTRDKKPCMLSQRARAMLRVCQ